MSSHSARRYSAHALSDIHLTQSRTTLDEKLLFHVRRYETAFQVQLTVLDWDKLSSNDHIGDASFSVKDLVDSAPQPDPVTGLYNDKDEEHPMSEYALPLSPAKETPWESKYKPVITFRYAFLCHVFSYHTYFIHQCQIPTLRRPATAFLAPVFEAVRY